MPVVKVWWHREEPARPHLPGIALRTPEEVTPCNASCPPSCPPMSGRRCWSPAGPIAAGCSSRSRSSSCVTRPGWPRPSSARPDLRAAVEELTEETVVEVEGVVVANAVAPGRRSRSPSAPACAGGGPAAAVRPVPAAPAASLPTQLDHAARGAAPPAAPGGVPAVRRRRPRLPVGPGRAGLRRGAHPEDGRFGDRVGSERVPASTTSAGRRTWPSRPSSTSRRWWACSSGSTRWGRCSGPSRTTPSGIWPSTRRWTWSWDSSATTMT